MASSVDIGVHIGDVIHLESTSGDVRFRVRLIGLVPGRSLIVTAPESSGQLVAVPEGLKFAARVFADDEAVGFSCVVERTCTQPYPYLHLSYPQALEATPTRQARRARVHLTGTAESDQDPGRSVAVSLHDISTTGALLWSDTQLGKVGEALVLRVPVETDQLGDQSAELLCEIRNVYEEPDHGTARWRYGVEFTSMSSATALALRALVYRRLSRSL